MTYGFRFLGMQPFLTQAYKVTLRCWLSNVLQQGLKEIEVLITMVIGYVQDFRLTGLLLNNVYETLEQNIFFPL